MTFAKFEHCCLVAGFSIAVLLFPSSASAKPKKKTYDNPPVEVFQAALRTARERHVVTYVDEKNLMLTFETGRSALADGFVANASVEAEAEGKSTMIINVQHKANGKTGFSFNAGDRMADKFYDQVTEELARKPIQKAAEKGDADHITVPTNALGTDGKPVATAQSAQAPIQTGTVAVTSSPESAEVSVDSAFVGNSPAVLKLTPGKHTVAVSVDGYKTWTRELTVLPGAETKLNAALSKQ